MNYFNNSFSEEVFLSTYQHQGETIEGAWDRVAEALSEVEPKDQDKHKVHFRDILHKFKVVPGGRILSNAGAGYSGTTLLNCFFSGFQGTNVDSIEGIMAEIRRQVKILKSEGGYGVCADPMRPRGAYVNGIGVGTPGAVAMLEMWDTNSRVITSGPGKDTGSKGKKKIRKGAMMVTMSVWHPDIEEFILAKTTKGKLTKFNMSVLVSDSFMQAVKDDKDWVLYFPDFEAQPELYDQRWDGDWGKWETIGGHFKVYKTLKARDLYNLIMENTYKRNEPGILFIDTINNMNNLRAVEHISGTNPCGEVPLPPNGSCLLISVNSTQYLNSDYTDFMYNAIVHDVEHTIRMMDNVIEATRYPLPEIELEHRRTRRLGLGISGQGSALMMLRLRYGSTESLKKLDLLYDTVANAAYRASAKLAKEKGPFPLWNYENFLKGGFHKVLDEGTMDLIKQYGLRNSHLLSIAPNGNTGILANCITGGIEPVFMADYLRTSGVEFLPEGIPAHDKWTSKIMEGDVEVKVYESEGITYKWDKDRGYTKVTLIEDYGVKNLRERGLWDPNAEWAATTNQLSLEEHLAVLQLASKYIDQSISKTVNLPADFQYESFKNLYMWAWETGTIKGLTTYREGTMTAVLQAVDSVAKVSTVTKKRPKSLPCDIHFIKANGEEWIVLIGLNEGCPYEIFAMRPADITFSKKFTKGKLIKTKEGYDLVIGDDLMVIKNISKHFLSADEQAITRCLSVFALRQGLDINYIVDQLEDIPGNVASFPKALQRTLKKYAKDGETDQICEHCSHKLVRESGCYICPNCAASKCS